jgi:hypothetical protein
MESIDSVIAALDAFQPSAVDTHNVHRLYEIFDGFRSLSGRERAAPAIYALLERFPDAELGSPGPLVHELEAIVGYQALLLASLHRQPSDLTVWMVNRILNSELSSEQRQMWLSELRAAGQHPNAPESTRMSVTDFLEYQNA